LRALRWMESRLSSRSLQIRRKHTLRHSLDGDKCNMRFLWQLLVTSVSDVDMYRHGRLPDNVTDVYGTARSCGGSHTLTSSHKRLTKLHQSSRSDYFCRCLLFTLYSAQCPNPSYNPSLLRGLQFINRYQVYVEISMVK